MHALHEPVEALLRAVAAEVVLPRFRNLAEGEIIEKAADDLVTVADREAELRLHAGLSAIDAGTRIVGEEACAADPAMLDTVGSGRLWLIDPIDGTHNYAHGQPPFGLMLALVNDGVPQAGWIFDPLKGRMCHGVLGDGAFVDGVRVTARATGSTPPVAALGTMFVPPEQAEALSRRAAGHLAEVPIPRCAAEQYARLLLGETDLALFQRTMPWDHAAGALILEEAGGRVAREDGGPYRVGDARYGLLAAATPDLWDTAAPIIWG
jgi:fructose-1,6-bisphosphatase/inositol monophosphatase family enzyme